MDLPSTEAWLAWLLLGVQGFWCPWWRSILDYRSSQLSDRYYGAFPLACRHTGARDNLRSQSWGLWVRESLMSPPEPRSSSAVGPREAEQSCWLLPCTLRRPAGQANWMCGVPMTFGLLCPPCESASNLAAGNCWQHKWKRTHRHCEFLSTLPPFPPLLLFFPLYFHPSHAECPSLQVKVEQRAVKHHLWYHDNDLKDVLTEHMRCTGKSTKLFS